MPITREAPTARPADPVDEDDRHYKPITEKPKPTRKDTELQHKREKAGLGLMQVLAFGAGMLGRFKLVPILPEDIAAVHVHARPIAKALADAADEDDRFAEVFDRLTELGPYGAIIEAVSPLVVQIFVNHKKEIRNNPALATQMGAVPPDQLLAMFTPSTDSREDEVAYNATAGDGAFSYNANGDGATG